MKKASQKQKKFLLKKSIKALSATKKRKRKVFAPRIHKTFQKLSGTPEFLELHAPERLTLSFEDSQLVLSFIKRIKKVGSLGYFIFLQLNGVTVIEEGAISMLLSVITELEKKRIFFKGNKPLNVNAKDILERSGFFEHMQGKISATNKTTKNKILKTGNNDLRQHELAIEIHKSMETVWGEKARCPSLYAGIGEMMRNSCDHAFSDEKSIRWHLGMSHFDDAKTVKFSFVDNGKGIISTYKRKGLLNKILNYFSDTAEMLASAFENGIESRTGLPWRGKGLPTIFEMYSEKIITNLIVITNNVYLDFDRGIYKKIEIGFTGTYYFWQVTNNCTPSFFAIKTDQNECN